jgi:hypothetical protein
VCSYEQFGEMKLILQLLIALLSIASAFAATITSPTSGTVAYWGTSLGVTIVTTASATGVQVTFSNGSSYTVIQGATGSGTTWATTLLVPSGMSGTYTITAVPLGSTDGTAATASVIVIQPGTSLPVTTTYPCSPCYNSCNSGCGTPCSRRRYSRCRYYDENGVSNVTEFEDEQEDQESVQAEEQVIAQEISA